MCFHVTPAGLANLMAQCLVAEQGYHCFCNAPWGVGDKLISSGLYLQGGDFLRRAYDRGGHSHGLQQFVLNADAIAHR